MSSTESPPELNHYQAQTSATKLRGQYYTPRELVAMILDSLHPAPGDWIVDPSCGDGSFLCGALEAVARRIPAEEREEAGRRLAERLVGFDIHPEAAGEARTQVAAALAAYFGTAVDADQLHIFTADVLDGRSLDALLARFGVTEPAPGERLLIVGNPPYVEAKRLSQEARSALRRRFPGVLVGAPDLCLYFLHVCAGWLRAGDQLAFVLPNKVLVNTGARGLRETLLAEGRLQRLWFATQARVFAEAAVYPIILFAGGPRPEASVEIQTSHITRSEDDAMVHQPGLAIPDAWYRRTAACALFPAPETPELRGCLEQLFRAAELGRVRDVLDIRWSISFHRKGLRERYIHAEKPRSPHARRFLGAHAFAGNGEVTRYRLRWAGWWMDYHEEHLRNDANAVPPVELFERPKIAICQHGRTLRAAFDADGHVLKDTFLCGVLREADLYTPVLCRHPRALVGLLCSRAVHFFYAHVFYGGHVNGGYLHFLESFVADVPTGEWTAEAAEAVDALVTEREACEDRDRQLELEEQIEDYVSTALGLSPAQHAALRAWAERDVNWTHREQVRALPAS